MDGKHPKHMRQEFIYDIGGRRRPARGRPVQQIGDRSQGNDRDVPRCAHDTEQRVPPLPVSIVTPVLASAPYSPALQHVSAQEGKTPGEIAEELNPDIAELFK